VEELTHELQQKKAERLARSNNGDIAGSEISSATPSVVDDDGRSLASLQSESFVHTSQMVESGVDGLLQGPRRSKAHLWNELKISCEELPVTNESETGC
jgi:peroxin-3